MVLGQAEPWTPGLYPLSPPIWSGTVSAIVAASSVFDGVVAELPDSVVNRMALPEAVKGVAATSQVMFHWSKHGQNKGDMRADTGTYQWVAESVRAIIPNPFALKLDDQPRRYQLIGKVERPCPGYPTVQYLRLVLKYVPRAESRSPEMLLVTYIPHTDKNIRSHLKRAEILNLVG